MMWRYGLCGLALCALLAAPVQAEMATAPFNDRAAPVGTREASLRELASRLDDLRALLDLRDQSLRELSEERDRRYEDRFKAQETATGVALAASKELTAASFASAEKAILKAENAQSDYNVRSNEFRGQLDDQAKTLMPRPEAMGQYATLRERADRDRDDIRVMVDGLKGDITNLRESRSESTGRSSQLGAGQSQWNWAIGLVVMGLIAALSLGLAVASFRKRP